MAMQEKPCVMLDDNGKHERITLTWHSGQEGMDYESCPYCHKIWLDNSSYVKRNAKEYAAKELEKLVELIAGDNPLRDRDEILDVVLDMISELRKGE